MYYLNVAVPNVALGMLLTGDIPTPHKHTTWAAESRVRSTQLKRLMWTNAVLELFVPHDYSQRYAGTVIIGRCQKTHVARAEEIDPLWRHVHQLLNVCGAFCCD